MVLEVSAYPKPGNVHRTADSSDTLYEHYLASAIAAGPYFREASKRGVMIYTGKLDPSKAEVGKTIKDAVEKMLVWTGHNTVLGSLMLLLPLSVAAGIVLASQRGEMLETLREELHRIVRSTTPTDTLNFYEAIRKANPGGLGKVQKLDVNDPSSEREILKKEINLFEVLKIASEYDSIAAEWISDYHITFDVGYPYFIKELKHTDDFNSATVHTYLKILTEFPDTLIARKMGIEKAEEVSSQANEILLSGGLTTLKGKQTLTEFDEKLRKSGSKLNPGTTADLVSSVLAVSILEGYLP
jgi:triphosphoribosyl-dephospho-CoA synthase